MSLIPTASFELLFRGDGTLVPGEHADRCGAEAEVHDARPGSDAHDQRSTDVERKCIDVRARVPSRCQRSAGS